MNWDDIEKQLHGYEDIPQPVDTDRLWRKVQPHITRRRDDHPLMLVIFGLLCMTCMSWMYINAKTTSSSTDPSMTPPPVDIEYASEHQEYFPEHHMSLANDSDISIASDDDVTGPHHTDRKGIIYDQAPSHDHTVSVSDAISLDQAYKSNIDQPKSETASPIYLAETHRASYDHTSIRSEVRELGTLSLSSISPLLWSVDADLPGTTIYVDQESRGFSAYGELQSSISYGHGQVSLGSEYFGQKSTGRDEERSLPSFGLGISGGVRWGDHWSLQTGLRYAHLYKYSRALLDISTPVEVDNVPTTELVTANDTRTILGTVIATQEFSRDAKRLVTYRTLRVPITLLYGSNHKQWGWDIGIGGSREIWRDRSGYIHLDSNDEYDIAIDDQNLYQSDGWALHGLVGARHYIGHGIDLYARARYDHHLASISSSAGPWREKLSGAHLDIGIRFYL